MNADASLAAPCSGAASGEFVERIRTHDGQIETAASILRELIQDDPSETRQRNLAVALRAVKVVAELVRDQSLPNQIKELSAQLQSDREERARMEAGVEFADEGAELPPLGGDECH